MSSSEIVQVLSHRDSSHANGALHRLNNLRRDGILCDLTIKVEGKEFKAHKAVMAACSDYFLNAICGGKTTATVIPGERGSVTVDLEHVTLRGFSPLLEYAYTSSLQVNASDVIDVLSAASYMQMFKVANACSEYMRSNILWAQSRLANMPGSSGFLNGSNGFGSERTSSPIPPSHRSPGLPTDVSTLLKATAANRVALGQPPLLIPMHSLTYDMGLQQLAASIAGQTLSSTSTVDNLRSTPPTSSSPCSRNLTQSPSLWPVSSASTSEKATSGMSPEAPDLLGSETSKSRSSSVHSKGGRKSLAVKIEARTDDEDSHSTANELDSRNAPVKTVSPTESEPMEDSWQAIQKMYSFRKQNAESDSHTGQRGMITLKTMNGGEDKSLISLSQANTEMADDIRDHPSNKSENEHQLSATKNDEANCNNNNNTTNDLGDYIDAMTAKARYSVAEKSSYDLFSGNSGSAQTSRMPVAELINGAMRGAYLQRQQLGNSSQPLPADASKHVALPAVPPNGQYMSVRRRTLQSTVPKPHQCQICGSRFTRFHNLKQHIKLHSGIKPYECDECGKRFTRNYTLRLHKMKHVGIRNFRCGTCDASFTSLGEFRAHLRLTMHSHVPGPSLNGHQSPPASNSEPEDLSSPASSMIGLGASGSGTKYPRYDSPTLNFQRSVLTDRVSLLTAALSGSIMTGDGTGSAGSSCGEGSPRMSDRSMSPQDLSSKSFSKGGDGEGDNNGSPANANTNEKENEFGERPVSNEIIDSSNGHSESNRSEDGVEKDGAIGSPGEERADSSSSELEVGHQYDRDTVMDGNIDRDSEQDDNNPGHMGENSSNSKNSTSDRPLSLVVNASA